jgi:hypothetical protein
MTHSFYAVMGGFTVDLCRIDSKWPQTTLTHKALRELAKSGHFVELPSDEIKDKSKADLLAKCLVVCQVCWLVVQSVARACQPLPLTLLEIHTMVHVVSALLMYLLWWKKPKDVNRATSIDPTADPLLRLKINELLEGHHISGKGLTKARGYSKDALSPYFVSRMRNFLKLSVDTQTEEWVLVFGSALLTLVYACVHMTASAQWHARGHYFPSQDEATWWDISCYINLASFGYYIFLQVLNMLSVDRCVGRVGRSFDPFRCPRCAAKIYALGAFLVVTRIYITVESFVSLRSVPLEIYTTPAWTAYIPHF